MRKKTIRAIEKEKPSTTLKQFKFNNLKTTPHVKRGRYHTKTVPQLSS